MLEAGRRRHRCVARSPAACIGSARPGEGRVPRSRRPVRAHPAALLGRARRVSSTSTSATSSAWPGVPTKTKRGEPSLAVDELDLLAKNRRPLPDTFHGLTDHELRYRQRYLDLLMNEETRATFVARARVIAAIRGYLDAAGFRRGRDAGPSAALRRRVRASRSSPTRTSSTRNSTSGSRPSSTSSG